MTHEVQVSGAPERPAFSGRRPLIDSGRVVGVEAFAVPPIPPELVDQVFAKFGLRYTKRWAEEVAEIDLGELRDEWRRQLAGFDLRAIRWALDCLPDSRPPTVGEFRALCRTWPGRPSEPEKMPARHRPPREIAEAMRAIVQRNMDAKQAQREADRRERLGVEAGLLRSATMIPATKLPPGMRDAVQSGELKYWDKNDR